MAKTAEQRNYEAHVAALSARDEAARKYWERKELFDRVYPGGVKALEDRFTDKINRMPEGPEKDQEMQYRHQAVAECLERENEIKALFEEYNKQRLAAESSDPEKWRAAQASKVTPGQIFSRSFQRAGAQYMNSNWGTNLRPAYELEEERRKSYVEPPRPQDAQAQAQPTSTQTQPAGTQAQVQPTETQAQPAGTQTQPTETQSQPTGAQAQPAGTQTQAQSTQATGTQTQAQPTGTQAQPAAAAAQPANAQAGANTDARNLQAAIDCIDGKYGNQDPQDRREALARDGLDYDVVQPIVNKYLEMAGGDFEKAKELLRQAMSGQQGQAQGQGQQEQGQQSQEPRAGWVTVNGKDVYLSGRAYEDWMRKQEAERPSWSRSMGDAFGAYFANFFGGGIDPSGVSTSQRAQAEISERAAADRQRAAQANMQVANRNYVDEANKLAAAQAAQKNAQKVRNLGNASAGAAALARGTEEADYQAQMRRADEQRAQGVQNQALMREAQSAAEQARLEAKKRDWQARDAARDNLERERLSRAFREKSTGEKPREEEKAEEEEKKEEEKKEEEPPVIGEPDKQEEPVIGEPDKQEEPVIGEPDKQGGAVIGEPDKQEETAAEEPDDNGEPATSDDGAMPVSGNGGKFRSIPIYDDNAGFVDNVYVDKKAWDAIPQGKSVGNYSGPFYKVENVNGEDYFVPIDVGDGRAKISRVVNNDGTTRAHRLTIFGSDGQIDRDRTSYWNAGRNPYREAERERQENINRGLLASPDLLGFEARNEEDNEDGDEDSNGEDFEYSDRQRNALRRSGSGGFDDPKKYKVAGGFYYDGDLGNDWSNYGNVQWFKPYRDGTGVNGVVRGPYDDSDGNRRKDGVIYVPINVRPVKNIMGDIIGVAEQE